MSTYDQHGRLLGSGATGSWGSSGANSLTPIDVTAQYLPYYDPNSPAGSQVLPTVNVSAPAGASLASFNLSSLFKPPMLYWLIAGAALFGLANAKRR